MNYYATEPPREVWGDENGEPCHRCGGVAFDNTAGPNPEPICPDCITATEAMTCTRCDNEALPDDVLCAECVRAGAVRR